MSEPSWTQDIVIPVMGATGAGKSTFINHLVGKEVMEVGKTLSSCTRDIQAASFTDTQYPCRIVIVDTPGFDDSHGKGDDEILIKIASWLESYFKERAAIFGGVIYLHDISGDRFVNTARRHFEMFQRLFGKDALSQVIIGTTKWERTAAGIADAHQKELKEVRWKSLVAKGAKVLAFGDSRESARSFVDLLVSTLVFEKREGTHLRMPREVGAENKALVLLSQKLREYLCF